MKNHKGFSAIEALLILIIVGLLGSTGWYIWDTKKKTDKNLNTAAQTEIKAAAQKDPTADWTAYSSKEGQFSLKYPSTWKEPSNKEFCAAGLFNRAVYLGANEESVRKCASSRFGQMYVRSDAGDLRNKSSFTDGYKKVSEKKVVVGDIEGTRIAAITQGQDLPEGGFSNGSTAVRYIFYTNNITYIANYIYDPQIPIFYQDVLGDFDLMVTKTLRFSS
ncbi:hypothetical protein BVY00_01535 [bacterium G20]|nr:hypothetical protein BVY00_01535 [bacterium G20]